MAKSLFNVNCLPTQHYFFAKGKALKTAFLFKDLKVQREIEQVVHKPEERFKDIGEGTEDEPHILIKILEKIVHFLPHIPPLSGG